ncbi:MAG: ribonucleoside triphosphate reductase [Dehalococcoidia bacterium]|jgi:ribonucleoside-triphosphate reductase|nr:ribonucleoside triphosphate reductase [Dehalococcoidia bacterium]
MTDHTIEFIRKREGAVVPFDAGKITEAVFKAVRATGEGDRAVAERVSSQVVSILRITCRDGRVPTVEEVQDLVEKVLVDLGYAGVAKSYILYREQHAKLRESRRLLDGAKSMVDDYIGRLDWRVNENSNMDYSLQGLNNYISAGIASRYWLGAIYPPEIRDAHVNGEFHLHDLGILGVYCCGWDLKDLLLRGFGGVPGKVESTPAKHLRSALGQIVNFFYTLQGEAAGAQAFSNFDTLLAPFVRYDKLDYRGVKQAMQEFVFGLNVPTRVGFQTPFTNLSMDLHVPSHLAGESVVIGGQPQEATYGEFQAEMDLLNQAFCEVMMAGDAKGRIFTFPIPTYSITKDFDWDSDRLDMLWKMTAKYGIPYFANFVNSDMKPEDTRSMCCRLRLDLAQVRKRGGGLFGSNPLTGSLGVVTINLPRLGYLASSKEDFLQRLDRLMVHAKNSLEIRRKAIERFTDDGLYPYSRYYLASVKARLGSYWANHFSTIGLIGMHEACLNFLGRGIDTPEGEEFAGEVLTHMLERLSAFQDETGQLYNLEATPGEGACYRLAKLDKQNFPGIIAAGNGHPYYTNSTHLPVNFEGDLFDALAHQDRLQVRYTGGTVFHCFLGERIDDPEACKMLVRRVTNSVRMPYFTLTPTFSICHEHGYLRGEQATCPECGGRCEVYSRVVGYFRPVQQWNEGKREEFKQRRGYAVAAAV